MSENKDVSLKPLVIDLPLDKTDYFEILGRGDAATMRSGLVTLQPGRDVGSHSTDDYEEILVVLEGSGVIETAGNGRQSIKRGQAAYNPPHTQHNVINTSSGILKYIYIVARTC